MSMGPLLRTMDGRWEQAQEVFPVNPSITSTVPPPTPEPLWTERTEESSMGASQVSLGKLCVHIRCWGWMVLKS